MHTTRQTVVETPAYLAAAKGVLSQDEQDEVVNTVAENPTAGTSLGGGIRKMRVARSGGGKRGGARIISEARMSKAFNKIMAGLEDAQAYLQGARDGYEVRDITVSEPDVTSIRNRTGLSQPAFARSIGVPLGTLKNWEQGRRRPEGPTRVLLALIDKRPSIVQKKLGTMSEPKKHHFLPQFYLRNFKINPQMKKHPHVS